MNRLHRYLTLSFITAALAMPAGMAARAPSPQDSKERAEKQEKVAKAEKKLRVYDAKHKDYHEWTPDEDRTYRGYLSERHEEYREFGKLNRSQQDDYWEWRHEHHDSDDAR